MFVFRGPDSVGRYSESVEMVPVFHTEACFLSRGLEVLPV